MGFLGSIHLVGRRRGEYPLVQDTVNRHDYFKFYQLPNSNLFTHHLLFLSREATSETYGPWVSSHHICLCDIFFLAFIFRFVFPKTQKYLAAIFCYLFYLAFPQDLFIQTTTKLSILLPVRD